MHVRNKCIHFDSSYVTRNCFSETLPGSAERLAENVHEVKVLSMNISKDLKYTIFTESNNEPTATNQSPAGYQLMDPDGPFESQ